MGFFFLIEVSTKSFSVSYTIFKTMLSFWHFKEDTMDLFFKCENVCLFLINTCHCISEIGHASWKPLTHYSSWFVLLVYLCPAAIHKGFKAGYVTKSHGPCSSPLYLTELLANITLREQCWRQLVSQNVLSLCLLPNC